MPFMRTLACLFLVLLGSASPTEAGERALDMLSATRVTDPVFGGDVMVYHGGQEDGPPILLIHGLGEEAADSWRSVVPELTERYHVIALDLPGFGASHAGNHAYTPDRYAGVIAHVLNRFTEEPAMVVGHSMGGAIAIRFADRYPDRVEALHLVSVAGILHRAAYSAFLSRVVDNQGYGSGEPSNNPVDRALSKAIRTLIRDTPAPDDIIESGLIRRVLFRGDPGAIAAFGLVSTDFGPTLSRVRAPTTIYWGGNDPTAPSRVGRLLAARLPTRELILFSGVAHVPMIESPERFNEALLLALAGEPTGLDARLPVAEVPGERVGRCRNERGRHFTGAYERIVIEGCEDVRLSGVMAGEVVIRDSRATLTETRIMGDPELEAAALQVSGSDVFITAGDIVGRVAMDIAGSSLDIAGTRLIGEDVVIRNGGDHASEVIFSVVPYTRGDDRGHLHAIREFPGGAAF